MPTFTGKQLLAHFEGNKTQLAEFLGMNRGTLSKYLTYGLVLHNGKVYTYHPTNKADIPMELPEYTGSVKYSQYMGIVQNLLSSGHTVSEIADLMIDENLTDTELYRKRDYWKKTITRWIAEGDVII